MEHKNATEDIAQDTMVPLRENWVKSRSDDPEKRRWPGLVGLHLPSEPDRDQSTIR